MKVRRNDNNECCTFRVKERKLGSSDFDQKQMRKRIELCDTLTVEKILRMDGLLSEYRINTLSNLHRGRIDIR